MKKISIILFLILYTGFTAGVTIKIHDCGGDQSTSIAIDNTDPCTGDDAPMADRCCKTELKTQKIDDAQNAAHVISLDPLPFAGIVPSQHSVSSKIHNSTFIIAVNTSPPPNEEIHISNSVFLI